ncbi:MAG: hypothetical protein AAFU54_15340 [Chloroflexota bacterium]
MPDHLKQYTDKPGDLQYMWDTFTFAHHFTYESVVPPDDMAAHITQTGRDDNTSGDPGTFDTHVHRYGDVYSFSLYLLGRGEEGGIVRQASAEGTFWWDEDKQQTVIRGKVSIGGVTMAVLICWTAFTALLAARFYYVEGTVSAVCTLGFSGPVLVLVWIAFFRSRNKLIKISEQLFR